MVNAFALPGGHVFIGQGLMQLMQHEDELAAVLGHEVEHVDLYHCAERVQFEAQMRRLHLEAISDLASMPVSVFKAGYSKELELEADREGARLAVEAGFSPQGAISLFEAMEKRYRDARQRRPNSPEEEAERVVFQTLGDYFRSHPPTDERIRALQAFTESQHWPAKPEKPLDPDVQLALAAKPAQETGAPRVLR
jgi:predicted Zn-dependent protease